MGTVEEAGGVAVEAGVEPVGAGVGALVVTVAGLSR